VIVLLMLDGTPILGGHAFMSYKFPGL